METDSSRPRRARFLTAAVVLGAGRDRRRHGVRAARARPGEGREVARRRVHAARQDDHRAGDLPHRRRRHRLARQPGPRRRAGGAGAGLLLRRDDHRARARAAGGQPRRSPARASPASRPTSAAGDAKESIAEAGDAGTGIVGFITDDLLPTSFVQPFVENEVLKVLVLAILFAAAISGLAPELRKRVVGGFETASKIVFGVIRIIMWAAPLGAFGGMAFTVAQFGGGALENLGMLMRHVLGHGRRLRLRRARPRRAPQRLLDPEVHPADQGRAADHRRHVVLGDRPAAPARQARARRRVAPERRRRPADGLLVQPRRHLHLPDAGRAVHRPGVRPGHGDRRADRARRR